MLASSAELGAAPRHLRCAGFALLLALLWPGGATRADEKSPVINFLTASQPTATLTIDELAKRIETQRIEVFEPYEQSRVTFTALPLEPVLDAAYGPSWRQREALLFTCRDGYQPIVPMRRILAHRPFVAIGRPGDDGFTILKDEGGEKTRVDLSPAYIIWENISDARVRSEGDYGWPYQVTEVDLVSFRSHFRGMAPPHAASAAVNAGFEAFVVHCSKCHTVNGRGGAVGPELNYPANPTEYMKGEWLRKWIADPSSMRRAPQMPAINPDLPDRARVIDEIVAYLEAMASHKTAGDGS